MAETQGENAAFVEEFFGVDPTSPLRFTSNVDVSAMTFSYALTPGSTYQGMSMALSGSGSFDSSTNVWTTSSAVTLGSMSWTTTGTDTITNSDFAFHSHTLIPLTPFDVDDDVVVNPDGSGGGVQWFTLLGVQVGNTWPINFSVPPDNPNWNWNADGPNFIFSTMGSSPTDGGAGTFTTLLSVPEPRSITMLGLGTVWLAAWRLVRRRSRV
jgi:hypothetical protein